GAPREGVWHEGLLLQEEAEGAFLCPPRQPGRDPRLRGKHRAGRRRVVRPRDRVPRVGGGRGVPDGLTLLWVVEHHIHASSPKEDVGCPQTWLRRPPGSPSAAGHGPRGRPP